MNKLAGNQEARPIANTTPLLAKLGQKRTAWSLWIATAVMAAMAVAFAIPSRSMPHPEWHPWALTLVEPVMLIAYAFPGFVVARRRPQSPIGWLLLFSGFGQSSTPWGRLTGSTRFPEACRGVSWARGWRTGPSLSTSSRSISCCCSSLMGDCRLHAGGRLLASSPPAGCWYCCSRPSCRARLTVTTSRRCPIRSAHQCCRSPPGMKACSHSCLSRVRFY